MHLGSKDVVKLPYGRFGILDSVQFLPNYRSNRDSDREEERMLLLCLAG